MPDALDSAFMFLMAGLDASASFLDGVTGRFWPHGVAQKRTALERRRKGR
jgi:hypothetical protein